MAALDFDYLMLRYCRQIIMQAMDHVRSARREENLPAMRCRVIDPQVDKSELNQTKAIDRQAEDLILESLQHTFAKLPGIKGYVKRVG